jgi:hypothetical protein
MAMRSTSSKPSSNLAAALLPEPAVFVDQVEYLHKRRRLRLGAGIDARFNSPGPLIGLSLRAEGAGLRLMIRAPN